MSWKKIIVIVSAFITGVIGCNFGGISGDEPLRIAFAAGDTSEYYGAVGVTRVNVTAEHPVDVDWSLEWKDGETTLPLDDYYRIRSVSRKDTMTVDLVCYSLTEKEAEISAWIHGAPHTKISKTVRAPFMQNEVTKGIDTIVMPPFTGSYHPLFPECETAVELVKLTHDMMLSVTPSGSPTDGFLRLVEQVGRHSYVFEIADPEGQPDITLENVLSTLYIVLDPAYTGYYRALQAFSIKGLYNYRFSTSLQISGIQIDESGKRLTIDIAYDFTEDEEKAFFAALQIPVLASAELYTLNGKRFGFDLASTKGNAAKLRLLGTPTEKGSGSYRIESFNAQRFVCTRNENARCVRAGGQFPQTITIVTKDTADKFAYLGEKLFLAETAENTRTVENGRTYSFIFSTDAGSELSDGNESVISGSRVSFRRVLGVYLTMAAKTYAEAHGLYSAPVRYRESLLREISDFELKGDPEIVYGCVLGRDSALTEEILTDAVTQFNALLLANGKAHTVSLQKKEYAIYEALIAAKKKGEIEIWLGTYEDVARGRFKYYERYIDLNDVDWGWNDRVTGDPFEDCEPGWYDDELFLFDTETESESYINMYEMYLIDEAIDVPVFMGEDVYRLPQGGDGDGYDALITQYRDFFDLIAQGWIISDQGLWAHSAENKP